MALSNEKEVKGTVERIIFRNRENGYTVLRLAAGKEEITCVGAFSNIDVGESIAAKGKYKEHPSYGSQFDIQSYEVLEPEDVISIERYLASGAIKGIGPSLAGRIVKKFQEDTFRILEEEPERLAEIKGISMKKALDLGAQAGEKRGLRKAMLFLQQYGVSTSLAVKIYEEYGGKIYHVLKENPYKLSEDIQGVGFKTADEIALRMGFCMDSEFRIRNGLLYALTQGAMDGHTFLPRHMLTARAARLLGIGEEDIEPYYMDLVMEKQLVIKGTGQAAAVYLSGYYYMELHSAKMLQELNLAHNIPEGELDRRISDLERDSDLALADLQKQAVREAVRNGLLILTGGPGTGKTTTINAIIRCFEGEGLEILLAAPTGRAAKRMSQATGHEARTIHRLLEISGELDDFSRKNRFSRNEENPLEADVIIIDEMSMVDISLLCSLLKAVTVGTRLILVGDANQLPSVGPGNVLKDLIDSGKFHVVKLHEIFRQARQSDIIVNAHKINQGEPVILDNKSRDFFFLRRQEADVIISVVITLVREKLPPYVNADTYDIQVLTPMRKGLLGVERLNGILQEYLNPPAGNKKEKETAHGIFREGDKVMQIKNNYQLPWEVRSRYNTVAEEGVGVYNGDMGIIRDINLYAQTLTVVFDGQKIVEYSLNQLDELELAYAVTIHKSQGSEYPAVVIPLLSGPRMLMNRNLLYTAVTRARKCVTIVGREDVFHEMAGNTSEQARYSGLKARILECYLEG